MIPVMGTNSHNSRIAASMAQRTVAGLGLRMMIYTLRVMAGLVPAIHDLLAA